MCPPLKNHTAKRVEVCSQLYTMETGEGAVPHRDPGVEVQRTSSSSGHAPYIHPVTGHLFQGLWLLHHYKDFVGKAQEMLGILEREAS